jgi:glycerol-3-phosphate acyltransferase PlsY
MTDILLILACLVIGYLLGSLNTSLIVGKLYGRDIRGHGSKSAGLTNALRVLGKKAAPSCARWRRSEGRIVVSDWFGP